MIRIEGRNIGDEGFAGSNARDMDTGRMSSEAAKFLIETIKKAVQPIEFTKSSSNKAAISESSNQLVKTLEENTIAVQEFFVENSESTEEFKKLIQMMEASIEKTGDASVKSIQDAIKQIEKIKITSSDPKKANEILGLDAVKNRLGDNLKPETIGGRVFKKLTNVDLRTENASQAFSAEKLFGLAPSKKTQIERLEQTAREEAEVKAKGDAASTAVNALTQASESTETTKPDVTKNAEGGVTFKTGIDRESLENKQVELLEAILAQLKDMGDMGDGNQDPDSPFDSNLRPGRGPRNRTRGPKSTTVKPNLKPTSPRSLKSLLFGQADDVASVKPNLKPGLKINSAGNPYNASNGRMVSPKEAFTNVADDAAKAGTNVVDDVAKAGTNVVDDVARSASTTSKVLGGTSKLLSRAAIPLTVGMGVYEGYTGYKEADQLVESGAINEETGQAFTEQDETAGKVEAVTEAAGGPAGALAGGSAGAAYGAAIGSIIPGAGTVIGGLLGGAIGGTIGYFAGSKAGEMAGDAATTTSGEAALEAAEDSGLYNKNWVGKSKINPEMLKETTDSAQLNAILADDDLSEKDTNRVLERLSEIDSGNSTPSVSASTGEMSIMDGYVPNPTSLPDVSPTTVPTGDAVNNMTDAVSSQSAQKAPTVINNITNNNTSGSQSSPVMVAPTTSRNATNSFIDFQRQQYTRI